MLELKCQHCGCSFFLTRDQSFDAQTRRKERLERKAALAAQIRCFAEEGLSQSSIADLIGLSRERIRQICNIEKIITLPGNVDHDGVEKLRQFALSSEGASHAEAAVAIGRSTAFVNYNLKKLGLSLRSKKTWWDRYRECAENGMTLSETARHFGHSPQRVSTTAKYGAKGKIVFKGARGPRPKKDDL